MQHSTVPVEPVQPTCYLVDRSEDFPMTGHVDPDTGAIVSDCLARVCYPDPDAVTVLRKKDPTVIFYPEFLTDDECAHVIKLAQNKFEPSKVGGGGETTIGTDGRTSRSAPLEKCEDDIIRRIEERAGYICGYPIDNIERLQVVHYVKGQQFQAHWDCFGRHNPRELEIALSEGYNRIITMLVYLNNPRCKNCSPDCHGDLSGATLFPLLSLALPPMKRAALFWVNTDSNLQQHDGAVHQGLPVCCGEKYALNIWIHARDLWSYGTIMAKFREAEREGNEEYKKNNQMMAAAY